MCEPGIRTVKILSRNSLHLDYTELFVLLCSESGISWLLKSLKLGNEWVGLGIKWVVDDRERGHGIMLHDEAVTEDTISFGQLVPILLLALPVMAFLEACYCDF